MEGREGRREGGIDWRGGRGGEREGVIGGEGGRRDGIIVIGNTTPFLGSYECTADMSHTHFAADFEPRPLSNRLYVHFVDR